MNKYNELTLSYVQKKRVCEFFGCSDGKDEQYPECNMYPNKYLECPLSRTFSLFDYLNMGEL